MRRVSLLGIINIVVKYCGNHVLKMQIHHSNGWSMAVTDALFLAGYAFTEPSSPHSEHSICARFKYLRCWKKKKLCLCCCYFYLAIWKVVRHNFMEKYMRLSCYKGKLTQYIQNKYRRIPSRIDSKAFRKQQTENE